MAKTQKLLLTTLVTIICLVALLVGIMLPTASPAQAAGETTYELLTYDEMMAETEPFNGVLISNYNTQTVTVGMFNKTSTTCNKVRSATVQDGKLMSISYGDTGSSDVTATLDGSVVLPGAAKFLVTIEGGKLYVQCQNDSSAKNQYLVGKNWGTVELKSEKTEMAIEKSGDGFIISASGTYPYFNSATNMAYTSTKSSASVFHFYKETTASSAATVTRYKKSTIAAGETKTGLLVTEYQGVSYALTMESATSSNTSRYAKLVETETKGADTYISLINSKTGSSSNSESNKNMVPDVEDWMTWTLIRDSGTGIKIKSNSTYSSMVNSPYWSKGSTSWTDEANAGVLVYTPSGDGFTLYCPSANSGSTWHYYIRATGSNPIQTFSYTSASPAPTDQSVFTFYEKVEEEVAGTEYTITFDKGNDGATGDPMENVSQPEGFYELPECAFQLADHNFIGWKIGDTTEIKKAGQSIKIEGNIVLTAQWEYKYCNVTFKFGEKTNVQKVEKNVNFTLKGFKEYFPDDSEPDGQTFNNKWSGSDGKDYTVGPNGTDYKFTEDVVLTPNFAKAVTVTFDLNGGELVATKNKGGTMPEGTRLEVFYGYYNGNENIPAATKTDCEFLGWEMDDENHTLIMGDLANGNSTSVTINQNTVFTAKWKYDGYTLTFMADGIEKQELLVKKGESTSLSSLTLPTIAEGKYFAGWKCDGTVYKSDADVTPTADMAFTAEICDYITVTLKFEGAADVVISDVKQPTSATSKDFQLKSPADYGFTIPSNKSFVHWSYQQGGETKTTREAWLRLEEDTTFTAVLETRITVTLYIKADGGEELNNKSAMHASITEGVTLPDSRSEWIQTNGPKGYTLIGWSVNSDASTIDYNVQDIVSPVVIKEDATLYAVWNYNYWTITLTNGKTGADAVEAEVLVLKTSSQFKLENLLSRKTGDADDAPTYASLFAIAHKDITWKDESNETVRLDDQISNDKDRTYTATYTDTLYTITFDTTGGDAVDSLRAAYGATITLPTPRKEGFVFIGWMDRLGQKFTATTMPDENITLTAGWQEAYTITFDANGGSAVESISLLEGETITLPAAPTKTNYKFVKWQRNGADFTATTMPAEDVMLTAVWEIDAQLFATKLAAINSATTLEAKRTAILDADALLMAWTTAGDNTSALDTAALTAAKTAYNALASSAASDLATAEKVGASLIATLGGAVALAAVALILKRRMF